MCKRISLFGLFCGALSVCGLASAQDSYRGHPRNCFFREEGLPFEFTPIRKHGIEFGKCRGASDPAERNNRLGAHVGSVHPANGLQPVR